MFVIYQTTRKYVLPLLTQEPFTSAEALNFKKQVQQHIQKVQLKTKKNIFKVMKQHYVDKLWTKIQITCAITTTTAATINAILQFSKRTPFSKLQRNFS